MITFCNMSGDYRKAIPSLTIAKKCKIKSNDTKNR
jgi:hypothetical protein